MIIIVIIQYLNGVLPVQNSGRHTRPGTPRWGLFATINMSMGILRRGKVSEEVPASAVQLR